MVRQDPRDLQVLLVRKALLDLRAPQARKVRKVCKDCLVLQVRLVLPGHKASKVYQERKGTRAQSVRWGLKDLKANKAHKVTPARKDQWVRACRSRAACPRSVTCPPPVTILAMRTSLKLPVSCGRGTEHSG